MPLLFTRHPFADATFGVWHITEGESFFREDLPLTTEEEAELTQYKNLRRLEWLAGRWLLHKMSGAYQRLPLAKDAFSKPFFRDNQHLTCSLSHSQGIVGALLVDHSRADHAPKNRAQYGCDLQVLVEKMTRLAPKFLNEPEDNFVKKHPPTVQFDLLHIFWTAKESLYKAYGLKEMDFRAHLHLYPFAWDSQQGSSTGTITKDDFNASFQLWFEKTSLPESNIQFIWTICAPEK